LLGDKAPDGSSAESRLYAIISKWRQRRILAGYLCYVSGSTSIFNHIFLLRWGDQVILVGDDAGIRFSINPDIVMRESSLTDNKLVEAGTLGGAFNIETACQISP